VRLVDESGGQLGVMSTATALDLARERALDLVEVAPNAIPPVARLLDFGRFKYEQSRHERETRAHQHTAELKEIRMGPKIGVADLETKVRAANAFLAGGHRVKVTVRFRGREITHANLGREILDHFVALVGEHGTLDRAPLLEGKFLFLILVPTRHAGSGVPAPVSAPAPVDRSIPVGAAVPA
jgi:translation initiation factor IF-3